MVAILLICVFDTLYNAFWIAFVCETCFIIKFSTPYLY